LRLASLCYTALKLAGLPALARRLRRRGVILCYHNVITETSVGPWNRLGLHMPLPTFERQLRWLAAHYEVVPLEEFVGRLSRGGSLRGVAAVTFDDGYAGVFDHAWPLLRALSVPATVFVVAEAPGRTEGFWWDHPEVLRAYSPAQHQHWLTVLRGDSAAIVESLAPGRGPGRLPPCCTPASWQTITDAVRSGLRVGVHSATHRSLPALQERDLRLEVIESRDVIRRRTGVTPEFFAYPYGLWDDRVRRAVRSAGYSAAFTLEQGHNGGSADPWALRRVTVPAGIGDAAFEAWLAGLNLRPRHGS
jgi:peptidoglycan/xylan/chitin deacetylase (PgdA/CDA1 family)